MTPNLFKARAYVLIAPVLMYHCSYKPEDGTQPGFTDVSCSGYQQHILRCSYEQTNEQCTAAVVVECGELRLYTCS